MSWPLSVRASLIGLAVILAAAFAAAAPPGPRQFTDADKKDVSYMKEKLKPGIPLALNLADPVQYRFIRRQFEIAGMSAKNSPQWFRTLDATRKLHQRSAPPLLGAPGDSPGTVTTITDVPCTNQPQLTSAALSSVPGGTISTAVTLGIYQSDNKLLASNSTSQYAQGQNVTLPVSVATPSPAPTQPPYALATFASVLNDGTPVMTAMQISGCTGPAPASITNTAPKQLLTHPSPLIKVCLGRTGTDCDYTDCVNGVCPPPGANGWFPIIGKTIYSGSIATPFTAANSNSTIILVDPQNGGACHPNISDFFSLPGTTVSTTNVANDTLNWNIPQALFGPICFNQGQLVTYTFLVGVTVNNLRVTFAITNAANTVAGPCTVVIPPMQLWWSCLAAGTKIRVADGSDKLIEDMAVGDRVVAGAGKTVLTVQNTAVGNEHAPMVRIETGDGHQLLLTEFHPVVTKSGISLAKELKAGDVVYTEKGDTPITAVRREPYGGQVWNLDVGGPDDHVSIGRDNTTFFANGILVGDAKMQQTFLAQSRTQKDKVLKALPKEWTTDYLNSLKRIAANAK